MPRKKQGTEAPKHNVFVINPPTGERGTYILMVSRGGGVMGGGQTAAFGVDRVITDTAPTGEGIVSIKGVLDNPFELVVEFSPGSSYILVRRGDVRALTLAEYTLEQRNEDKEIEELLATPKIDADGGTAVPTPGLGQYL